MTRYINYFWYFIAGSLLIGFWSIVLIVAIPRPWYQFRKPAYHESMMNVAKQIGFSPNDAILEGGGWYDCSIVYPSCTCYQFMIFPTEQNVTEFQQQIEASGLPSISPRSHYGESNLFDYLSKTRDPVLQVNGELATWDYFKSHNKGFNAFSWNYDDQQQRRHFIKFFGTGEIREPLQLLGKHFSSNLVAINTEMGHYLPSECESGAQVTKKP